MAEPTAREHVERTSCESNASKSSTGLHPLQNGSVLKEMTRTGLEHTTPSLEMTGFIGNGGAESGALGAPALHFDFDLATIINALPTRRRQLQSAA
jgi:hypothetical protein